MLRIAWLVVAVLCSVVGAARAEERSFAAGSLIIPMDLTYQDHGMFQAYGLVFQLLRQGVPVAWAIDPDKVWHATPCDTPGDLCAWDCAIEGSGVKCPYPTASPDFFAASKVVWDGEGELDPGDAISQHGYRGGPLVVAAAHREQALAIIDAWNDKALWTANPWARRTVFRVVTVHEATGAFTAFVTKDLLAAPTIAVFSDGNEDIATQYLRAAGIPQSSGAEFPSAKCGATNCGPGTANPDMLTVPSVAGDMGTCNAPNQDHRNGALFTADGLPAYCQIMSMHWNVSDREKVQCDGGACPDTQAQCAGKRITYHGHEVVAEVRSFLQYPTHFFAECQAVNAYENTVPNPAWPWLDDPGRRGHFLTTEGTPPACPCPADFTCVSGVCQPSDLRERGAGFLIADQPSTSEIKVLRPNIPYNQLDGWFPTTGGSEPAYNLSTVLGSRYINDRAVTFLTGPDGPGVEDVWMTGYIDGVCDICGNDDYCPMPQAGNCGTGKVSYLGGHNYKVDLPLSNNGSQGARMFLNALFEADCVTLEGQPRLELTLEGDLVIAADALPVDAEYLARYQNGSVAPALDASLRLDVPAGVDIVSAAGATLTSSSATWAIGAIGGFLGHPGDPAPAGSRPATLRFAALGSYQVTLNMRYRVGASMVDAPERAFTIRVVMDSDNDGVPDDEDPAPNDPTRCGDSDADTCDDCALGPADPLADGPDSDDDGTCDAGESPPLDGATGGCSCRVASPRGEAAGALWLLVAFLWLRRRR